MDNQSNQPSIQSPPFPQPNLQTTSDVTSAKKPKNWLVIIIIIFFLSLWGIAVSFLNQKRQIKQPPQELILPSISPTLTAITTSPATDFKLHFNEKYGFSFNYPPVWQLTIISESELSLSNIAEGHLINIKVWYITGFGYCYNYGESKKIVVGGRAAETADGIGGTETEMCQEVRETMSNRGNTFVLIKLEGDDPWLKTVHISYDYPLNEKGLAKSNLNQLLSSFKFTKPEDPTTNWKVYSNNELTFKYPSGWIIKNNQIFNDLGHNITIYIVSKDSTLMNECMKLDTTERKTDYVVKKFSRVTTGEMCSTNDGTSKEIWVIPSENDYSPGINYIYTTEYNPDAEYIFKQILSTFKFIPE